MNGRSHGVADGESAGREIVTDEPVVNVRRFDAEAGEVVLGVREESVQLLRGMGTICLQVGLDVKAPVATKAGRFLALQADPRAEPARYLRAAQSRLRDDDLEGAILEARRPLEWIKGHSGWQWSGGKDRLQRTQDERWAWIRFAVEDQTSAAVHKDAVT
ncbi:hypothetical protein ACWEIK_03425 [Streptomyces sp. NPDC004673]